MSTLQARYFMCIVLKEACVRVNKVKNSKKIAFNLKLGLLYSGNKLLIGYKCTTINWESSWYSAEGVTRVIMFGLVEPTVLRSKICWQTW